MTRCNGGWLAGALLALAVVTAAARGQETPPKPTADQQKLIDEADKVYQEGMAFYSQGRLPEATARLQKVLEVLQQAYPQDQYPDGHPLLVQGLTNLGGMLQMQREYAK